jgi:hypothetical protein
MIDDHNTDFDPASFSFDPASFRLTPDEQHIADILLGRAFRLIDAGLIHPTEPFPPEIVERFPPPPKHEFGIRLRGDLDLAFFPCANRAVYVNMFRAALSPVGTSWVDGDEHNQYFCVQVPLDESITGRQLLDMTDVEFASVLNVSLDELRRVIVEAA